MKKVVGEVGIEPFAWTALGSYFYEASISIALPLEKSGGVSVVEPFAWTALGS